MSVDPFVTVRYDLRTASTEGPIRDKLIEMGWTPPGAAPQQAAPAEWTEQDALGILNQLGDGPYGQSDVDDALEFMRLVDVARRDRAAPQQAAPAELKPLTEGQIGKLYRESAMRDRIMLCSDWEQGVRDAEAAHGIKGEQK